MKRACSTLFATRNNMGRQELWEDGTGRHWNTTAKQNICKKSEQTNWQRQRGGHTPKQTQADYKQNPGTEQGQEKDKGRK